MNFVRRLFKSKLETKSRISRALSDVVENDSPSTRKNLHSALVAQRLILPVPSVPENLERDSEGRLQEDASISFLSLYEPNGRKSVPVFTNPEAMKKWKSDVPFWIASILPQYVAWLWSLAILPC
jgi:hypothetical protein